MDPELSDFEEEMLKGLEKDRRERKEFWKLVRWLGTVIGGIALVIGGVVFMVHVISGDKERQQREAVVNRKIRDNHERFIYSAWAKETGNHGELTFEEFKVLKLDRDWTGAYIIKNTKVIKETK